MIRPVLTETQARCLLALATFGREVHEAAFGGPVSGTQRDVLQILASAIEREEGDGPFEVYPDHESMRRDGVASEPNRHVQRTWRP